MSFAAARLSPRMACSLVYPVVATVPTGLERGAADECYEKLGREATVKRGSITCVLEAVEELIMFDQLRSIDNYHIIVKTLPHFCREESTVLDRLESLPFDGQLDWTASLLLWQFYSDNIETTSSRGESENADQPHPPLPGEEKTANSGGNGGEENEKSPAILDPDRETDTKGGTSPESSEGSVGPCDDGRERPYCTLLKKSGVTFRATCTRGGRKHCFTSQDAAKHFGAGLARYFGWKVQLKQPDIEVLLAITGDVASVGVALTREAKFKRNIAHFGPTTLRATIAYGMLRCADIQPGDIVLDPLCGGGTINIEGSLAWPDTHHVAGDIHHLAVPRVAGNISSLLTQREKRREVNGIKIDVCQWDVCNLPLRSAGVDVIVTDLPFGKKSGNRLANWELYPKALSEMARVCRPLTARAVLLTHDNKALSKSVQRSVFWKRVKTLWINVGGLEAALYILHRSSMPFSQ